jgi:hypothetical protein
MANTINIQLSDIYEPVTDEQVRTGKNFVLRRESAANGLASLVDALMEDATARIVQICYKYGADPQRFTISPNYNSDMFKEIAEVMDELEEEILDLTGSYAVRCTKEEKKKAPLLLWVLALGKNNKGLRQSLIERLRMFLKDIEAMIVATRLAKIPESKAVTLIKSNIHTAYQIPGMQSAFKNASLFEAEYIRSRGVKRGNVGSSNSEANNIFRFVKMAVQMAWMKYHRDLYEEQGAVGYYVLRGSTYPCELCQSKVGFHPIDDTDGFPMYHANCQCYTVPIFEKDINDLTL